MHILLGMTYPDYGRHPYLYEILQSAFGILKRKQDLRHFVENFENEEGIKKGDTRSHIKKKYMKMFCSILYL